jgi:hypothetical protein
VGNQQSQARFLKENERFLGEWPNLEELAKKTFIRRLPSPSADVIDSLSKLPDNDPRVIEFEDRSSAEVIIFYLGRMAIDDFGEILMLSGNGYGFGAHKIVRGMYERVVTSMYIAAHPPEARLFAEQASIEKWKLWTRTVGAFPEMAGRHVEDIERLKEENDAARSRRKQSICSKCNQTLPDPPWTRKSLDVMAKEVDEGLYRLYGQFYLEGTAQSHANPLGIERRLKRGENGGWIYKDNSEDEGRFALNLGHSLFVRTLKLQNDFFDLQLHSDVQQRIDAYVSIWNPPGINSTVYSE